MSEEKHKPGLDEQTLANLLEAAYVLQEHNRERRGMELVLELKREQIEAAARSAPAQAEPRTTATEPAANADYTFTLARIVETQRQIQVRHLDLQSAMSLVAERLIQIARASGAAIGVLDGTKLHYRAAAGTLTLPAGTEVPMEKALCVSCLRTGEVFRTADINTEFSVEAEECRRRGIQSLIAVPIFHEGEVAGGLEIYYPTTQAFNEQDVHTCQLMAGLVTEGLARDEEVTWKKSLATERAVMMEALEKLKPNLAALVDTSAPKDAAAKAGAPAPTAAESTSTFVCRRCGHQLVGEEQFCGSCGRPRRGDSDYEAPSIQSKVASLWHMQEAMRNSQAGLASDGSVPQRSRANLDGAHSQKSLPDSIEKQMAELLRTADLPHDKTTKPAELAGPISAEFEDSVLSDLEIPLKTSVEEEFQEPESTALTKPEPTAAWSSAASAREFLEQLAPQRSGVIARLWNTRRGDIYLTIAVLLVGAVLRWGIWSNHSVSATASPTAAAAAHRPPAPDADLSLFDRMLISLGLAEAPPAPEYKGNPNTQVWVDLHTALYYCPGADLYGKTPKGKLTSQRDAQLDQFQPAYRKACD